MALYLGIDLPEETKQHIYSQLSPMREDHRDFMWYTPDDYTIQLMPLPANKDIPDFEGKMERALYDTKPFELFTEGADLYMHNKITFYLSFYRSRPLEELVSHLRSEFEMDDEKTFVPKITLARTKIPSKQMYFHLKKVISEVDISFNFPTDSVSLYESILGGKKTLHLKKASFAFPIA